MGNEITCTARFNGKAHIGRALLETSEIIFRGDDRLKIPFFAITSLHAADGELHIRTKNTFAIFELGAQAEKWRHKIANPKSLLDKLGVKPGETISLLGSFPADFLASLKKHGAHVNGGNAAAETPWIFLALDSQKSLAEVKKVAKRMKGAAALWLVYPKGQQSITEHHVRAAGLKAGLTDIKVASFNSSHTALKFVFPKSKR